MPTNLKKAPVKSGLNKLAQIFYQILCPFNESLLNDNYLL